MNNNQREQTKSESQKLFHFWKAISMAETKQPFQHGFKFILVVICVTPICLKLCCGKCISIDSSFFFSCSTHKLYSFKLNGAKGRNTNKLTEIVCMQWIASSHYCVNQQWLGLTRKKLGFFGVNSMCVATNWALKPKYSAPFPNVVQILIVPRWAEHILLPNIHPFDDAANVEQSLDINR